MKIKTNKKCKQKLNQIRRQLKESRKTVNEKYNHQKWK